MLAEFTNVRWEDRTLSFTAQVGELVDEIWFELPAGVSRPDDDLIAVVMATLAGPDLSKLTLDLDVSETVKAAITTYCGCECGVRLVRPAAASRTTRAGHVVSFSGGFDSLAAYALLPNGPELVSMDFGGWFQRETDFFKRFDPYVVRTNFRMAGFGRRSWMFMLAGIVLLRDHLDIGAFTTGSILESSPWHYRSNIEGMPQPPELLRALGFSQVNTTIGITEVATTLLAMKHFPEYLSGSLASLAAPGSGKSMRKQMLVESLHRAGKATLAYEPTVVVPDTPPLQWGQSLTDDMLAAYMLKHSGHDRTKALMSGIPASIVDASSQLTLNFYERYHTGLYYGLSEKSARHIRNTLANAGIHPFAERDWAEYRHITGLLSEFHKLP